MKNPIRVLRQKKNLLKCHLALKLHELKPDKPTPKISFGTTCMGRLYHLKETLPKNVEDNKDYPNVEFVILDYNSADNLGAWVRTNFSQLIEQKRLSYYRTEDPAFFRMAHSKNVVCRLATGDIVCNLDADNFTGPGLAAELARRFNEGPRRLVVCGDWQVVRGSQGRVAIRREQFLGLRGYNENFQGYGYEDLDFINRCRALGFTVQHLDAAHLQVIQHSDEERRKNYDQENKKLKRQLKNNSIAAEANLALGHLLPNRKGHWGNARLVKNFSTELVL